MSNKDKVTGAVESKEGIDIEKVTFDENGEVVGLDDTVLADISGGLASEEEVITNGSGCNQGCGG